MLRHAWIAFALVACEPTLRMKPLPELVKEAPAQSMSVSALLLVPGESMVWDVHMQGFTIGRVELDVGEARVRSRFVTAKIVSSFARVRHDLTTTLDHDVTRPIHALDALEVDGERTRVETTFAGARLQLGTKSIAVPDGNFGHTLHSALGVVRAWAHPDARPGYLYVIHAGELFRLEFAQPLVEDLQDAKALRVECRVRGDLQISMTIWLRASDRTPLRIEIRSEEARLTAELIAS
jgi:hypothetical protein